MTVIVKDLMVPISEYATVSKGSTLFEAILVLKKAQDKADHTKDHDRAVLIMDKDNRVIGKLSQLDVLRSLESEDKQMKKIEENIQFGFSPNFITKMKKQYRHKGRSMNEICLVPAKMKVENCMNIPSGYEYIEEDIPLDIAMHQLLMGPYLSLMATRDKDIVGILRLSDVFTAVVNAMKENESTE